MNQKLRSTGTYRGMKDRSVWFFREGGLQVRIDPCNDIRNHSPDGFNWGYHGSGPAQLALAICCHYYHRDVARAEHVYQWFKQQVIAYLDANEGWELSAREVGEHLLRIERECFDRSWHRLEECDSVDASGSVEYQRVRREWNEAGRPVHVDLDRWIFDRANIGPNG